jgi:hypothetical protein
MKIKKILSLTIISVMILTGCQNLIVPNENKSTLAPTSSESKLLYKNKTYNYSLNFTDKWNNNYVVEERKKSGLEATDKYPIGIYVSYKSNNIMEPVFLFGIEEYDKSVWEVMIKEEIPLQKITEKDGIVFAYILGSENPIKVTDKSSQKDFDTYNELANNSESVIKTFKFDK